MDWVMFKRSGWDAVKKYRYVLLVLLVGVLLMTFPAGEPQEESAALQQEIAPEPELQHALAEILSKISGAGKVEVLLTEAAGEKTVYQTDENRGESNGSLRRETVVITNSQREEGGLIQQIDPPIYQGAVVVCQGGDSPQVRLAIVEAVANATGLTADRITVLKMK